MKKAGKILFVLCFLLAVLLLPTGVLASQPFELHLLDVGQGQSVLIQSDGHWLLIDGGGREASSFVVGYLHRLGVERLDAMLVSHYDEDHMAGMIGALSVFQTELFLAPGYAGEGELYRSLAAAVLSNGCGVLHPKAGWTFELGSAKAALVGPVGSYGSDNDNSLALRFDYGETAFLICGDAEAESEQDMVDSGLNLDADVYVVNHHGSSSSTTEAFLDAVSPEYALISCGAENEYGHPSAQTLERLKERGVSLYRTDKQGTIVAASDGRDISFDLEPCTDWTPGSAQGSSEEPQEVVTRGSPAGETDASFQYVCNINTMKFHRPDCKSVGQMSEKNRLYTDQSREELLAQGYAPCGNCKP